jgi:ribosome-interacting GTPase 1
MDAQVGYNVIVGLSPVTLASERSGDIISLKNVKNRLNIIVSVTQGNAAQSTITINQCSAVAGTGRKVITNAAKIFVTEDITVTDVAVEATAAVNYQLSAGTTNKLVVFSLDVSTLDLTNNFDCLEVVIGSSNAANLATVLYAYEPIAKVYPQLTAITD